jgi:hypothetical protein
MARLFERDLGNYNNATEANRVGRREDIADMITMVDAKDTPFTSMARKGAEPSNTLFQWQVDKNADPRVQPVVDGTDESTTGDTTGGAKMEQFTIGYRATLAAYPQIFRRKFRVSKLTESNMVRIAGTPSERSRQMAKAMLALKRDCEVALTATQVGSGGSVVGAQADNGTVGYRTRSLDTWTKTQWEKDSVLPVPDQYCTPADNIIASSSTKTIGGVSRTVANANTCASPAALNESHVQDLLTAQYNQSGQFKTFDAIVAVNLKRAFSNLVYTTPNTTNTGANSVVRTMREGGEDTYIQSIDIFQGDFGQINLHPSHWLGSVDADSTSGTYGAFTPNKNRGFVIPFEHVEVRYGGNIAEVIQLVDNGGGPANAIEMVLGLCIHNPLLFGKFDFSA